MADIDALMTSSNKHYCTPPDIIRRARLILVPKGSGRRLGDFATNDAGRLLVRPHAYADGIESDGLTVDRRCVDTWWENPPYGDEIEEFTEREAYWGRTVGVPGVALLPARDDTKWCQGHIFATADAWVHVAGRFTFWMLIPLERGDAAPPKKRKDGTSREPYYLRRWYPNATADNLPDPFILVRQGWAIGPELGENGRPQSAPFPSLIPFWADPNTTERDPRDEVEALRELVHAAAVAMRDQPSSETVDTWLAEAECLLGSKRFRSTADLDMAPFERLADATQINPPGDHPISIKEFARRFGDLGKLTIARGRHAGVYINRRRVGT